MSIGLYDHEGNYHESDSQKTRLARMQKTINAFFRDTDATGIYAQHIRDRGTYYPVLITLTYPSQSDWDKRDITKLIDAYRKDWRQRLGRPPEHFRYLWVAEQQKRGTIHYHIVLFCPRGKSLAKPDQFFKKGMTKIEGVRKGIRGYMSKYLSKGTTGHKGEAPVHLPKGARLFGHGGMSPAARAGLRYFLLPAYVKKIFRECDGKIKRIKGGWRQGVTDLLSPWEVWQGELNGIHMITINWVNCFSIIEDHKYDG